MRKKFLLFLLTAFLAFPSMAQDFEYEYEGQTITYTVLDENAKTCITREGSTDDMGFVSSGNKPIKGKLALPSNPKFDGVEYTLTKIGAYSFYFSKNLVSVEIPNSVSEISDMAFNACYGLTKVSIPNSVSEIGDGAFADCIALIKVTITDSESKISDNDFYEGTIPNSVSKIGSYAFLRCIALTEITIPNYISEIGEEAFSGCSALTKVTLPNSVTKIGEQAFSGCIRLTQITIPESVTKISDGTFYECSALIQITIPNSVTEIGSYVFFGCSGLTEVTIPGSVIKIELGAFFCDLTEINYITDHPEAFEDLIFPEYIYNQATLYVMPEGLELAAQTVPWMYFKNIQAKDFDAGVEQIIGNLNSDIDPNAPMEIYTLDGKSVSSSVDTLAPGIYIVHQGSFTKKIIVK